MAKLVLKVEGPERGTVRLDAVHVMVGDTLVIYGLPDVVSSLLRRGVYAEGVHLVRCTEEEIEACGLIVRPADLRTMTEC